MNVTEDAPIARPRWRLARDKADELTTDYSVPPIPVTEIAEAAGVEVVLVDFQQYDREVSGFCDFADRRLYANQNDSFARRSFTIAHELGHWVLHKEYFLRHPEKYPVLPRFTMPNRMDPLEREANHFAANLLVPDRLLKQVSGAPIARLARAFNVSIQMMEWRVKNGTA